MINVYMIARIAEILGQNEIRVVKSGKELSDYLEEVVRGGDNE